MARVWNRVPIEARPRLAGCQLLDNVTQVPQISEVLPKLNDSRYCVHCTAAQHVLSLLRIVFNLHGMEIDDASESSLEREYSRVHTLSERGQMLAFIKYKCAAGFSFVMDQDMPDFPPCLRGMVEEGPHWAGGRYYAFLQYNKRISIVRDLGTNFRRSSFAGSLLMLKKGMPRPTPEQCMQSKIDAFEVMTTPQTRTASQLATIDRVGGYAERVVDKLFGEVDFSRFQFEWPSVSSHSTVDLDSFKNSTSSSNDGALGHLRNEHLCPVLRPEDFILGEECISQEGEVNLILSSAGKEELIRRQALLVQDALDEFPQCFVESLPEAAKIRSVTAGPVKMYHALRPVQHLLHRVVSSDPRFAIDRPLDGRYILEILGFLPEDCHWISGDYKAATDNLAMELSVRIALRIAERTRMPAPYVELLVRSLTGHYYLDRSGDVILVKPQARGQLMGSVTSFPILCIANFALIWSAMDWCADQMPLPFEAVKTIVNGDDCLFPATDRIYDEWKNMAADVGLTPSVGKTYRSREFMIINSEMYSVYIRGYDLESYPYGVDHQGYPFVPCVNSGLLVGMKRSGNRETSCQKLDDRSQTIGARCSALVRGWSYESTMRNSLIRSFISCNLSLFPDGGQTVPLHLPERWGGYGLPMSSEFTPSLAEKGKWVKAFTRDYLNRLLPLRKTRRYQCLQHSNDTKKSPFYKECFSSLSKKYGTTLTDRSWTAPGPYQWIFIDRSIPRVTDDNLDDFVRQWVGDFPIYSDYRFIEAEQYISSHCPVREIPNATISTGITNFRVIGWSALEPKLIHHPFHSWTGVSGGHPTFYSLPDVAPTIRYLNQLRIVDSSGIGVVQGGLE